MTDAKELERVRAIHRFLDHCAATLRDLGIGYQSWVFREESGLNHLYTADEIRAWPEMKRKLRAHFGEMICHNRAVWIGKSAGWAAGSASDQPYVGCQEDLASQYRRGLCMYREMLEDEKPKPVEPPPVDPYEQHRLSIGITEEQLRLATDMHSKNEAARARNIAALRVELDRPISEQPHPREYFSGAVRRYR